MANRTTKTDDQMIAATIAGDKEAFGQLVERHEQAIKRYVTGIIMSEFAANDVTQETFIKAYINLRSYRPGKKFTSWLYRIAHNEAISYMRKHRRELTTTDETWMDRIVDESTPIEELLDIRNDRQVLLRNIRELKPKYREPIVLHVFEGRSYEEISEILRIPKQTVGTHINRAKQQLKTALEKEGVNRG